MKKVKNDYTVYMHVFPDMKVYVGATGQDPRARWKCGNGHKHQKRLYVEIAKYDWEDIQHIIIAEGLTKKEAWSVEIDTIKYWDATNPDNGYNTHVGGQTVGRDRTGVKMSVTAKRHLSKCNSGKNSPNYGKEVPEHVRLKLCKPVCQYDLQGNFIKEWESQTLAATTYGINVTGISLCCTRKQSTSGGYKWKLKGDNRKLQAPSPKKPILRESNGRIPKKTVLQYTLNGDFICEWESMTLAAEAIKITPNGVGKCCRGESKSAGGFIWKYKHNNTVPPKITPVRNTLKSTKTKDKVIRIHNSSIVDNQYKPTDNQEAHKIAAAKLKRRRMHFS